jgi:hypothetical protein
MTHNDKILYLLNFDISKTLHENSKCFLIEQKKEVDYMTGPGSLYGTFGYDKEGKTIWTDMDLDVDTHDILMWGSLVAFFFGPWGRLVSLGLDLGNAYLYHKEGQDLEAGLQLAFSLIPMGDLIGKIPVIRKYGKEYLEKLILKSSKGQKMTQPERKVWKELMESNKILANETSRVMFKESFKRIFKNFSLPNLVQFIMFFSKKHPKLYFLTNFGLQFGGVYYTYHKLANIFGIKNKVNQTEMKKIIQEYEKNPEKYKEEATQQIIDVLMTVPQEQRDSLFNVMYK